jgi:hypothetical protein
MLQLALEGTAERLAECRPARASESQGWIAAVRIFLLDYAKCVPEQETAAGAIQWVTNERPRGAATLTARHR